MFNEDPKEALTTDISSYSYHTAHNGLSHSDIDDGKTLLYRNLDTINFFKTSDRLLDDIKTDLSFILFDNHKGILKSHMLEYSKEREGMKTWSLNCLLDQVVLQTNYEYPSKSCPSLNKINVHMGILFDESFKMSSPDSLVNCKLYHLRITVKTRTYLEKFNRTSGVTHYYLVDKLCMSDNEDLCIYDDEDPRLIDFATYVSKDTNKVIRIEIIKPEFSVEELKEFTEVKIKDRYLQASRKFPELNMDKIPTQGECLNTLFKIFKNPLNNCGSDQELRTISADNIVLNSQINPSWLIDKFKFELTEIIEENGTIYHEYKPPDLADYSANWDTRKLRESYIRKSLELIFLGKHSVGLLPKEVVLSNNKLKFFQLQQIQSSNSLWYQTLNEIPNFQYQQTKQLLDLNYHFINLSVCYFYSDTTIIKNYETQISLDPSNIGFYFDSLSFIANAKASYQLISYCSRQNIIGQEALESAIQVFNIDPNEYNINQISDQMLIDCYKEEYKLASVQGKRELTRALKTLAKYKNSMTLKFYADFKLYSNDLEAYQFLEVDISVDTDIIQTAYSIKVTDSPGFKLECDRALYTIAANRRSMVLFNFLLQESSDFQLFYNSKSWSYQRALDFLNADNNMPDNAILDIFQNLWNKEEISFPDQLLDLKMSLSRISDERNSKLIKYFLETGKIDINYFPAQEWPTGINNIGNTCYLNSLLQYYFTISPLRQYILDYEHTINDFRKLGLSESDYIKKRRIGGREVSASEVERSVQFTYQLRNLFNDMIHTKERYVIPSKELAYLAFSPSTIKVEFDLSSTNFGIEIIDKSANSNSEITDTVLDKNVSEESNNQKCSYDTNELTFDNTITSSAEEFGVTYPSAMVANISIDQLENTLEIGRQQDVTECIGNVLFQLESASHPLNLEEDNEQDDLIKQLFYGKIRQDLIPIDNPEKGRTKFERFVSLLVNIGDHPRDIYDALDLYFKDDLLNLDEDGEVKRILAISQLPTILQIQIQRVYYDRKRFIPFKSIEPLPFNEVIYMDRYMATKDPILIARRNETMRMKEELNFLKDRERKLISKNQLGYNMKGSLMETKIFLESSVLENNNINIVDKNITILQIDKMIQQIDVEISQLQSKIQLLEYQIQNQFVEFNKIGYLLFAVFIHRGEASYGHYWIYIKDYNKNIWRKYNDETVTEVPVSEVFNFLEGNTSTPYFLVYIKEGNELDIQPLKRIISSI